MNLKMDELNQNTVPAIKWLFLDLNSYFASVEQQECPQLRGKPVAVVPMMTDSTCAIAASYEAKAFGVKTGTMIYEAKKMCPGLICVQARHDVYVDYHHRIFDEVENHLHVTKICSIDEAACLLLGREREPDNIVKLSQNIKAGIWRNVGPAIHCSIGAASNSFLAKIASDMQKPNGLVILKPDDMPGPLFDLKLLDLPGINVKMESRLNKAGIDSVEQFWNLAPKHARTIWGSVEGERFWYALHGYDLPDRATKKSVVGHSRVLEPSLRQPDQAYAITRRLLLKAATRLRRYNLFAGALFFKARTVERQRWAGGTQFTPAQDNFTFLEALSSLWRLMQEETHGRPLLKVSVSLSNLRPPEETTRDLFSDHSPTPEKARTQNTNLSAAMDRLNRRPAWLHTQDKGRICRHKNRLYPHSRPRGIPRVK